MDVIGEIVSAWIQREIDRIENSGFRRVAGANQAIHPRRWGPVERTDSPEIAYLNLNDAHGSPLTLCVPLIVLMDPRREIYKTLKAVQNTIRSTSSSVISSLVRS